MANSSFETFKQGGEAMEDAAKKTGQQAQGDVRAGEEYRFGRV